MMKVKELLDKLNLMASSKTVYMMGCFGQPLTKELLAQKKKQYAWYNTMRCEKLVKLIDAGYFGFDCLGMVKAAFWGWNRDSKKEFGGCKYQSNGVPDTTELGMINMCSSVSSDFSKMQNGELLYMKGHVGIVYDAANKMVAECTPGGTGNVQIRSFYCQKWEKHGKLPWVDYSTPKPTVSCPYGEPKKTLVKGDKGSDVSWLQWHLIKLGFLSSTYKKADGTIINNIDGSFGKRTDEALRKFQTKYPECGGKDGKPDGKCGSGTRTKLKYLVK